MGYMGFGMQKWIYTQRPRKPFSKRRRVTGDTIEKYTANELKIAGRTHKSSTEKNRKIVLERIGRRSFNNKVVNICIAACIILLTILVLVELKPWAPTVNNEQYHIEQQKILDGEKKKSFNLSMAYGKNYLNKGDLVLAKQEFYNALEIFPDNTEALEYLIKSYVKDCIQNEVDCEKARLVLDKLIEKEPENIEYLSYRISLGNIERKK
jgi:hypothetical protein